MEEDEEELLDLEVFRNELEGYLEEYEAYLAKSYKPATVRRHSLVIGSAIEFACGYHDVTGFEHITRGVWGSRFVRSHNHHSSDSLQAVTAKNTLLGFLRFVRETYGFSAPMLTETLKKKKKK